MTHTPTAPFAHTSGPRDAKIVFVAEAWGEMEEKIGRPLVGQSGQEFRRMCQESGIDLDSCLRTNVLALRPPENKLEALCASKAEVGLDYTLPAISQGNYLRREFLGELERLHIELDTCKPNLVVLLGNLACWAVLRRTGVGSLRGYTTLSSAPPGLKCLPTYHPAGVLRNWAWRPIVLQDLQKAVREARTPEIVRPQRKHLIQPTLAEIQLWVDETLHAPPDFLACDIETKNRQTTMIGFARSAQSSLVIPFVDESKPGNSYWPTAEEEIAARRAADSLLGSEIPKLTQNGSYDMQYLWREGFKLRAFRHDSMLLHHGLFPELLKGLGFLGSIYTDETAWKNMRKSETTKRDE